MENGYCVEQKSAGNQQGKRGQGARRLDETERRGVRPGAKPLGVFPTPVKVGFRDTMQGSNRNTGRKGGGKLKRMVKMLPVTEIPSHLLPNDQP